MTVETKIVSWGKNSITWVQLEDIESALNMLQEGEVDGFGISPYNGYKSEDISFLADVSGLRGVVLPYASNYDLTFLERIPSLRFITVAGNTQPINYGIFPDLEELRIEWHSKLMLPIASSKLSSLYIRGYKPKSKTLTELPAFENVTELEINQGNIINLEGVERLELLSGVGFFHLRQLQSVAAITKTSINSLHIEGCKKVLDIEILTSCQELTSLRLIDCGKLRSLKFLGDTIKLEDFRFVNTIIDDGDMTPLLQMKSVGFLMRASYSHSPEEIRKEIADCNG